MPLPYATVNQVEKIATEISKEITKKELKSATSGTIDKALGFDISGNLVKQALSGNIDVSTLPHVDLSGDLTLEQFNAIKGKAFYDDDEDTIFYPSLISGDDDIYYIGFYLTDEMDFAEFIAVNIYLSDSGPFAEKFRYVTKDFGTRLYKHIIRDNTGGGAPQILFKDSQDASTGFRELTLITTSSEPCSIEQKYGSNKFILKGEVISILNEIANVSVSSEILEIKNVNGSMTFNTSVTAVYDTVTKI